MADVLKRLAKAVRTGTIPKGSIEDGTLRIERLAAAVPQDAEELILDLYRRISEVRITDILLEVDAATGFGDAFTRLRTRAPCNDRIGLLNVLLAEGLNLGLRKMAEPRTPMITGNCRACRAGTSKATPSIMPWPWSSLPRAGCPCPNSGGWVKLPPAMASSLQLHGKERP